MGKYDSAPTLAAGLIRLARDKARLTQGQLAERAEMSQQAVSAYETGRKEPTLPTLQRLVAAAGFEMRIHLAPSDDHDVSVERFVESLTPEVKSRLERSQRHRLEQARLNRLRGH
ncbi:MAG TPA: helix-turn-helix transcriptional regulator [Acidimicrobiia bacterium]|nr:helix-turn-helix transcriptional regulator [Acidimicrobiia bacterium]